MFTVEQKNNTLCFKGSIDEQASFPHLDLPPVIEINCSEITSINSVGVKAWINYFQSLTEQGITATLVSCPPCIVEQTNLITNFIGSHKLKSIKVPYICEDCNHEQLVEMNVEEIKAVSLNPEDVPCEKCSNSAEFDELPDEYFHFITRESA